MRLYYATRMKFAAEYLKEFTRGESQIALFGVCTIVHCTMYISIV